MNAAARIVLIDDTEEVLLSYSMVLRKAGYDVWTADSGQEGLRKTREVRPDLVILDVMLPDTSGMKVCRQIKTDPGLHDVFVVLWSGLALSTTEKVDGLEVGADDYLTKPLPIGEFRARIRTILRLRETTVALRESERHYRQLVNILPEAVALIGHEGSLVTVNPQAVSLLGYTNPDELLQRPPLSFIPDDEQKRLRTDLATALKTGIIKDATCTMLRKDGSTFIAELSGAILKDAEGLHSRGVVVVRDTTARRRAADALQASEERFRQLAENIHGVFWILDPANNRIIYVSKAFETIWGRDCKSLTDGAINWNDTVHPDDRERLSGDSLERKLAGNYEEVYRICRPDGSIRWIDDRAFPVKDSEGRAYRVVGIATDISKTKQAEDALREAESKYRSIVDNANEAIFTCSPDGRYLNANPALARILGFRNLNEMTGNGGKSDRQVAVWPELLEHLRYLGSSNTFGPIEVECRGKDKQPLWVRVNGRPVRNKKGVLVHFECMCQDITAERQAEEELRQLPRRIIEAQEAERLRVAFELHDGVNQTIASAKMRLRKVQDIISGASPAAREILSRCEKLLVQALEENRRIAHNLHPSVLDQLGLAAACRALCQELHARSNMEVECDLPQLLPRLPPEIELNIFRIAQEALTNVEKHAKAKKVALAMNIDNDSILMVIRDNGSGFDTSRKKKRPGQSQGIGLTSLRERAAILGGIVELRSTKGAGTTITMRIPCQTASAPR